MIVKSGDVDIAIGIIREAAEWLMERGQPLWKPEELAKEKLLNNLSEADVYVGWENSVPITAMVLQWYDPLFWKDVKRNESGFIHKLAVRRKYAGKGFAGKMIEFAEYECGRRNIHYLRLDCAGDRPELCGFYERQGFLQVNKKMIGVHDVAFYEKKLK